MKLCRLTEDNVKTLHGKKMYCYEYSSAYMEELECRFGIDDSIEAVIDDNIRNQGVLEFRGNKINVQGSESLERIDWTASVILIMSDYYSEAFEKLCAVEIVRANTEVIYYFENRETAYEMEYRTQYKDTELQNIIVFRSGPHASSYIEGTDFYDNARALFEYMLANGYNRTYELVWLVKNPEDYSRYSLYDNVRFLSFDWSASEDEGEREQYYQALCLAKYIFFTDAYGFARNCRKDQIRVQLWHGCGFKTRVNFVRCEKRYEYTTVISELYSKIHQEIYGLREDQMLVTGYAKQDWLFSGLEDDKWDWLEIPKDNKCIFWLPTFRTAEESLSILNEERKISETGLPIVDTMEKLTELNSILENTHIMLLAKLHPFQKKTDIYCAGLSHIKLLDNHELYVRDIQVNQLLSRADALISDYSSAAVDYMLLDRPIAFTLDDIGEYAAGRGFVFNPIEDWLPGTLLYTLNELCDFVKKIADGKDVTKDIRKSLAMKMHRFHDGNSCKRIVESLGIRNEQ